MCRLPATAAARSRTSRRNTLNLESLDPWSRCHCPESLHSTASSSRKSSSPTGDTGAASPAPDAHGAGSQPCGRCYTRYPSGRGRSGAYHCHSTLCRTHLSRRPPPRPLTPGEPGCCAEASQCSPPLPQSSSLPLPLPRRAARREVPTRWPSPNCDHPPAGSPCAAPPMIRTHRNRRLSPRRGRVASCAASCRRRASARGACRHHGPRGGAFSSCPGAPAWNCAVPATRGQFGPSAARQCPRTPPRCTPAAQAPPLAWAASRARRSKPRLAPLRYKARGRPHPTRVRSGPLRCRSSALEEPARSEHAPQPSLPRAHWAHTMRSGH